MASISSGCQRSGVPQLVTSEIQAQASKQVGVRGIAAWNSPTTALPGMPPFGVSRAAKRSHVPVDGVAPLRNSQVGELLHFFE